MNEETYRYRQSMLREFTFLPLFYLIPKEFLEKRGLGGYPRDPMEFAENPEWTAAYYSKVFQVQLMDIWAQMMWQALGIRGGFDCYSTNDPFVRMAVDLPFWAALSEKLGMSTDLLAMLPEKIQATHFTQGQASQHCAAMAAYLWALPQLNLSKIREVVETHRSHDDYANRYSNIKVDFYRKYYHTRSKWAKTVPLEEETDDTTIYGHTPNQFAEAEYTMWLDSFCKRLNKKDAQIVHLLNQGYTQQEIADILGYANHSGVSKRISKYIRPAMTQYRKEDKEA